MEFTKIHKIHTHALKLYITFFLSFFFILQPLSCLSLTSKPNLNCSVLIPRDLYVISSAFIYPSLGSLFHCFIPFFTGIVGFTLFYDLAFDISIFYFAVNYSCGDFYFWVFSSFFVYDSLVFVTFPVSHHSSCYVALFDILIYIFQVMFHYYDYWFYQ